MEIKAVGRVSEMLARNALTRKWLMARLEERGISVYPSEYSSIMCGQRKGPKAEKILEESLKILESYETFIGEALRRAV